MSDDLYDYTTCLKCGGSAVMNKIPDSDPANGFGARCMNPECGEVFTCHKVLPVQEPDDSQNQN